MTDLEKWLKPKDVSREMARAYASGKTVTQISIDFGYPTSTTSYILLDYLSSDLIRLAAKQLRNKKHVR